jgi:hypothetical protein
VERNDKNDLILETRGFIREINLQLTINHFEDQMITSATTANPKQQTLSIYGALKTTTKVSCGFMSGKS